MPDRKTVLFAQLLITCMMAASMSGIMSLVALGPTEEWLRGWPVQFITAWPIAFVLSIPVGRIAFGVAGRVMGQRSTT